MKSMPQLLSQVTPLNLTTLQCLVNKSPSRYCVIKQLYTLWNESLGWQYYSFVSSGTGVLPSGRRIFC